MLSAGGRLCTLQENPDFWVPTMKIRPPDGISNSGQSKHWPTQKPLFHNFNTYISHWILAYQQQGYEKYWIKLRKVIVTGVHSLKVNGRSKRALQSQLSYSQSKFQTPPLTGGCSRYPCATFTKSHTSEDLPIIFICDIVIPCAFNYAKRDLHGWT